MSHKGFLLQQLNLVDQEIALYEALIGRFSDFTELFFEVQVNLAIMHKTLTLVEKRASNEVMPLYNDLIARLGERSELEIQQIVAQVLVHNSIYLSTLGQQPEALACYESVVARFAASQNLTLLTLVAQSLENLLDLYAIQEKPLAIIELCDKIHFRFSRGKTLRFKQLMARSLATKANILLKFNKTKETVRFFDEIVARYKQSTDPSLQTAVNNALTNVALISLICEDMTSSKLRIQQAEKANQATSLNFVAIQFIRFLIDDISIENFIDKAEKLAENTTFDRSFATLDGFIKRLPATKNRQVNAALDFFENHHDINKFRKEISH
jgi:tetratricopeptide (TPR) repeat protein